MDSFTEVTDESWFGRIKNAIFGTLIGGALFLAAFPTLFLNEGCVRRNYLGIVQTKKDCVQLTEPKSNTANNGKPIHLTAELKPEGTVADEQFNMVGRALKLTRKVEMYQWKEESRTRSKKKLGGGKRKEKTYTYKQVWSPTLIKSDNFHVRQGHENPTKMKVPGQVFRPKAVLAGDFNVPGSLVDQIKDVTNLSVKDKHLQGLPEDLKSQAKISGDKIYIGQNPSSPRVGDTRIGFSIVKPQKASMITGQNGKDLVPFKPKQGNSINYLKAGAHGPEEMFQDLHNQNQMMAWIVRGVGFLMMLIGLCLVFSPLKIIADFVPFIGTFVGAGIGLFAGLISIALSLMTIAIAWVFYRPLLGIPLLVVAVVAIVLVIMKGASSRKAAAY